MKSSSTAPAKKLQRTYLTAAEVMERMAWNENDLKEAIVSGQIVPSKFVNTPIWPMPVGSDNKRSRALPAVVVNDWMFAVGIRMVGPFDCEFEFLAKTPDAMESNATVYTLAESGYFKARTPLRDIIQNGSVEVEQLRKFEANRVHDPLTHQTPGSGSDRNEQWWNTDHDPWTIAKVCEAEAVGQGWGVNQRGPRAGRYPLSTLSGKVAEKINRTEVVANKNRKIGDKTIANFLKKKGWS